MTGLPGSGKSTLAEGVARELRRRVQPVEVLDEDAADVARLLGPDYGREGRQEGERRLGVVARLLSRHGVGVCVAAVSPDARLRSELGASLPNFLQVHVDCPLRECEARDSTGLYAGARAGTRQHVPGLQVPYEPPESPDVAVHTDTEPPGRCVERVLRELEARGLSPRQAHTEMRLRAGVLPPPAAASAAPSRQKS